MNKSIYCGVAIALGFTVSSAFALTMSVTPKTYYCSSATFSTTDCVKNDSSGLIPGSITMSSEANDAINEQFDDGAFVGAVVGGASPEQIWSYPIGNSAGEGLAMNPSSLESSEGNAINVSAYYVPCGTSPTGDGLKASGATLAGTELNTTAIAIGNTNTACSSGGNIYLTLTPTAGAKEANGFILPGDYSGDINLTMADLSG